MTIQSNDANESPHVFLIRVEIVPDPFPVTVTDFTINGTSVEFTVLSNPAHTYRVATSLDLSAGSWVVDPAYTGLPVDTNPQTFVLPNAYNPADSRKFFRIEAE